MTPILVVCYGAGMSNVEIPENAFRAPRFLAITEITRGFEVLDLPTVVFIDGGDMMWVDGDEFVVSRIRGTVDRYRFREPVAA